LTIAREDIPPFLSFLAKRGCHGALLLGTTGEGPSFSFSERLVIFRAAVEVREEHPGFRLLAGTGTPSLEETIQLTKTAFDLGFDAVVVLPPYYYHRATPEGLAIWYHELLHRAVPKDRFLLGYHFPVQTGVPIPLAVIQGLRETYPSQFAGFKDSTASAEYTFQIGKSIDQNTLALVGNDKLLVESLEAGGNGCITGMANLHAPVLRSIWDSYQKGTADRQSQAFLVTQREVIDPHRPFPVPIKALLHALHDLPDWSLRPPLTRLPNNILEKLIQEIQDWVPNN
jgi:4-hydroxy-tetrahydrodipicolinate synthase